MLLDRCEACYLEGFNFTVNRKDFFYTPKFYKLYKHLIYFKRVYPESPALIRVESKFKNLEEHIEGLNPDDENKWGDENEEWAKIIKNK
jgi:hypothetical protein